MDAVLDIFYDNNLLQLQHFFIEYTEELLDFFADGCNLFGDLSSNEC